MTCLGLALEKMADFHSTLTRWIHQGETIGNTFGRQALGIIWDYAAANPFGDVSGSWDRCLAYVSKVIEYNLCLGDGGSVQAASDRCQPDVLVIQDTFSERTSRIRRIARLNAAIAELAEPRGMALYTVARGAVWEAFRDVGERNKQDLAMVVARHIPALENYVPTPRKPWKSEDPSMGIFDAAALALTFFKDDAAGLQASW
jgi:Holliday junction resolvasome RuvABC endonuclease subunit